MHKLLDFPAYGIVLSELKDPLDIEQLLDLILHVHMSFPFVKYYYKLILLATP